MKIGYPCINLSLSCRASTTFRLRSYSPARLREKLSVNLACLREIIHYNAAHGLLHFRISSDLVPFASHPVCRFRWGDRFQGEFEEIGRFIRRSGLRVSMHPDQFTLINSPDPGVVRRSGKELDYHAEVLDRMGLGPSAKVQIHVGGVYGDREGAMRRFASAFARLGEPVRRRLVVENDERSYPLRDCLRVHELVGVPVVLDVFHHRLLNRGETIHEALSQLGRTWRKRDGLPIVDFSCQEAGRRRGSHCRSIDLREFKKFLRSSRPHDFDLMLEIKDKEKSALKALRAARRDRRLAPGKQLARPLMIAFGNPPQ